MSHDYRILRAGNVSADCYLINPCHCNMDSPCSWVRIQMDLMMVFEKFDFKEYPLFFPINVLRNYARLQVC